MKYNDRLLDLVKYRKQKQKIAEEQVEALYRHAQEWTEREINIREKVRAKMIFMKRFNVKEEVASLEKVQQVFMEWFLFDYKTINGDTLFFQYLRSQENNLLEPFKILGALFLTASWVPVKIKGVDNDSVEVLDIIQGKVEHVKSNNVQFSYLEKDTILFIRKIPLVLTQWLLGPYYVLAKEEQLVSLQRDYESTNQKNGVSWRTYLKEEAPRYILFKCDE